SSTSLPDEKSGGLLQDVPLLAKDLVLPAQPLQLCRDIALRCHRVDSVPIPAPPDPADQCRQANPQITGDLALRSTARLRQADRFFRKFLRKPSLLCHRVPHRSWGTLHFPEASPTADGAFGCPWASYGARMATGASPTAMRMTRR